MFYAWQMLDGFMPEARVALQRAAAFVNEQRRLSNTTLERTSGSRCSPSAAQRARSTAPRMVATAMS